MNKGNDAFGKKWDSLRELGKYAPPPPVHMSTDLKLGDLIAAVDNYCGPLDGAGLPPEGTIRELCGKYGDWPRDELFIRTCFEFKEERLAARKAAPHTIRTDDNAPLLADENRIIDEMRRKKGCYQWGRIAARVNRLEGNHERGIRRTPDGLRALWRAERERRMALPEMRGDV